MTAEPWVSMGQLAEYLCFTSDSIYRGVDRKNLPALRVEDLWKFKVPEADVWVRAGVEEKHGMPDFKKNENC